MRFFHPGVDDALAGANGRVGYDERKSTGTGRVKSVSRHRLGVADAVARQVGPGQLHRPLVHVDHRARGRRVIRPR